MEGQERNVYFLATYPPRIDHVSRMVQKKDGTTGPENIECPTYTNHNNIGMRGTDLNDQLTSYFALKHRSIK